MEPQRTCLSPNSLFGRLNSALVQHLHHDAVKLFVC